MKEENEIKSSNSIYIVNSKTIKQLKFQRIKSPFKNYKKNKVKEKEKKNPTGVFYDVLPKICF